MAETRKNFYDDFEIAEIKSIPITDLAERHGLKVHYKSNNAKYIAEVAVRHENTPSCKIANTNTFCDFGNPSTSGGRKYVGGDNIVFLAYLNGDEHKLSDNERFEYMNKLAQMYGITPKNQSVTNKDIELTNEQWSKIGINGDMASKNIEFDFDKFTKEQNMKFAERYRMSMNELLKAEEKSYYKIINDKAIPHIFDKKNSYYTQCYFEDKIYRDMGIDILKSNSNSLLQLEREKNELVHLEKVLDIAIKDKDRLTYKSATYDVVSDIEKLRTGELSFQMGTIDYLSLKKFEKSDGHKLNYCKVTLQQYSFIRSNDIEEIPHSAFVKGDIVNIAYTDNDKLVVQKSIQEVIEIKDFRLASNIKTLERADKHIELARNGLIEDAEDILSPSYLKTVEELRQSIKQQQLKKTKGKLL